MDADRDKKLTYLKAEIERGSYRIDPKAVADAIVRRLRELAVAADGARGQNRCS